MGERPETKQVVWRVFCLLARPSCAIQVLCKTFQKSAIVCLKLAM